MVDTGNIEWDVVEVDRADVINLERKGDYWEEIDYSLFDTANIDESHRYKYSVDMLPYAQIRLPHRRIFRGSEGLGRILGSRRVPGAAHLIARDWRRLPLPRSCCYGRRRGDGRHLSDRH